MMRYQVTQQFIGRPESNLRSFKEFKEAKQFMEEKLANDALYKVKAIYRIYEDEIVKEKWDQEKWEQYQQDLFSSNPSSESPGGAKSQSTFRPTPLNTTPHPRGTPSKWLTDAPDEEEDDDND